MGSLQEVRCWERGQRPAAGSPRAVGPLPLCCRAEGNPVRGGKETQGAAQRRKRDRGIQDTGQQGRSERGRTPGRGRGGGISLPSRFRASPPLAPLHDPGSWWEGRPSKGRRGPAGQRAARLAVGGRRLSESFLSGCRAQTIPWARPFGGKRGIWAARNVDRVVGPSAPACAARPPSRRTCTPRCRQCKADCPASPDRLGRQHCPRHQLLPYRLKPPVAGRPAQPDGSLRLALCWRPPPAVAVSKGGWWLAAATEGYGQTFTARPANLSRRWQ